MIFAHLKFIIFPIKLIIPRYPQVFSCKLTRHACIIPIWIHKNIHVLHATALRTDGSATNAMQRQKSMMTCTDAEEIIAWVSVRNAEKQKRNATARR